MKLGICIDANDAESVWNAFGFGNYAVKHSHDEVQVFLLGKAVEAESLSTEQFQVMEQMEMLAATGGLIMACGSCLKLRQSSGSEICPLSTMQDLYRMVAECDNVLTF